MMANPFRASPHEAKVELRRELGLLDSTLLNVGTILASGIFLVPASIAFRLDSSLLNLAVWVVAGVFSLFGALILAELGAAMPEAGGIFVFLKEAFSPLWGFLYGWSLFWVIQTGSIAAVAVFFATYLGYFFPLGPWGIKLVAILSILVLSALNYRGVRVGAATQNALTLAKLAIVLGLLALSFVPGVGKAQNFEPLFPQPTAAGLGGLLGSFGLALVAALWCYDGWVDITYVGGEVKDPGRTIPRSIVLSMVLIFVIYLALNLAFISVLSVKRMAGAPLVATDLAQAVIGKQGGALIAVLILISTLGANNGFILTGTRVYYAMARERLFFHRAAQVHPRYRTPHLSLLFQAIWASLLTLSGRYEQLFTYVIFAEWIFFGLTGAAVVVLRRRRPDLPRPYRAWGYPVVPVVFVLFTALLLVSTVVTDLRDSAIGLGLVLTGLPFYFLWRRKSSPATADHSG